MSDTPDQQSETNLTGGVQGPVLSGTFAGPVTIVLNASPQLKVPEWQHVNWEASLERYQQELERQYGTMQVLGMNRPVSLDSIFTDAYLLDKPSAMRRHNIEDLHARGFFGHDEHLQGERQAGIDLVNSEQRLFIFGKPGAGKTTFLKYLTKQSVRGVISALPIFISLKAWSDANCDLMAFMEQQFVICGFPNARAFITSALGSGQALVLFDGLDEVNLEASARNRITTAIRDCARQYSQCRIAITCRTAATDYTFEGFRYCEVADLSTAQIQTFAENWFRTQPAKLTAFQKELGDGANQGLRDLARTPLLLTLLCLTFDETMQFPMRRAELYEEAIDALLKKWDSSRQIQRDALYKQLSLGHKRQLLAELAAQTFQEGKLFIKREELSRRIATYMRRVPGVPDDIDSDLILQSIEAQHGLLIERAANIYSFSHLTFQEYFTARYIASKLSDEQFQELIVHAHDARWRELLLLTASMLEAENAARLFQMWTAYLKRIASDPLIRSILTTVNQWTEPQHANHVYQDRVAILVYVITRYRTHAYDFDREITMATARAYNIYRASDIASTLARASDRNRALDIASASDLAHDIANDIASDIALANVGDIARVLDIARALASNQAHALARDLARDRDLTHALITSDDKIALDRELIHMITQILVLFVSEMLTQQLNEQQSEARSRISQYVWWYTLRWAAETIDIIAETIDIINDTDSFQILRAQIEAALQQLATNGSDQLIAHELLSTLPPQAQANRNVWKPFLTHIDAFLRCHKNIVDVKEATDNGAELLNVYLTSTVRLVECFNLATIADRDAILNELLILPDDVA